MIVKIVWIAVNNSSDPDRCDRSLGSFLHVSIRSLESLTAIQTIAKIIWKPGCRVFAIFQATRFSAYVCYSQAYEEAVLLEKTGLRATLINSSRFASLTLPRVVDLG